MIKSIRFKRFKSFKAEQTLELRPITVIIGKNNSGKSAILKLVRMLQHSINEDKFVPKLDAAKNECPLIYNCEAYKYADILKDLAYLKKINLYPISIDLSFENNQQDIHTKIISFSDNDNKQLETFEKYSLEEQEWVYSQNEKTFNPTFNKSIVDYHNNIIYWSALRPQLERYYGKPSTKKAKIDLQLINFIENKTPFIEKKENGETKKQTLREATQDWYKTNLSLDFDFKYQTVEEDLFSFHEIKESEYINLADVGEGIAQTLPIVIETLKNEANTLHIVEQPELHLHPAAHASMAQLFADAVNKNNSVKFLVETHSQNFILRLRMLRAKGILSAQQLKLYWVKKEFIDASSSLEEIKIDDLGNVSNWPDDVFKEGLAEVKQIAEIQLKKRK